LNEKEECVLYENRPVICRIYGVPFSIKHEKKEHAYACGISGFETKVAYPTVKLDKIYNKLSELSSELLTEGGSVHPEKAGFMLSIIKVVRMPFEEIVKGEFE